MSWVPEHRWENDTKWHTKNYQMTIFSTAGPPAFCRGLLGPKPWMGSSRDGSDHCAGGDRRSGPHRVWWAWEASPDTDEGQFDEPKPSKIMSFYQSKSSIEFQWSLLFMFYPAAGCGTCKPSLVSEQFISPSHRHGPPASNSIAPGLRGASLRASISITGGSVATSAMIVYKELYHI